MEIRILVGIFTGMQAVCQKRELYYFGMQQPGRGFQTDEYRFKYQSQEVITEVYESDNLYDFRARFSDVRIGGDFWSIDPKFREFPGWSPYAFSLRRPIDGIELEGAQFKSINLQGEEVETETNPNLGFTGLSDADVAFINALAANKLLPQSTEMFPIRTTEGTPALIPIIPDADKSTSSTDPQFAQIQQVFNQTFNPQQNIRTPFHRPSTGEITPLIGIPDQLKAPIDVRGRISPGLHNYLIQNTLQFAATHLALDQTDVAGSNNVLSSIAAYDARFGTNNINIIINVRIRSRIDYYLFPNGSSSGAISLLNLTNKDIEFSLRYPPPPGFVEFRGLRPMKEGGFSIGYILTPLH